MTKHFKLVFYENLNTIIIQRRVCFFWITLVDTNNDTIKFKCVKDAEIHLNNEKRFGDKFIIDYRKII